MCLSPASGPRRVTSSGLGLDAFMYTPCKVSSPTSLTDESAEVQSSPSAKQHGTWFQKRRFRHESVCFPGFLLTITLTLILLSVENKSPQAGGCRFRFTIYKVGQ